MRKALLPPAPRAARVSYVRHALPLQLPLLDTADDVDGQLAVLPQRPVPVGRDRVGEGEVAGDGGDHHLAYRVIVLRVGVDVLHAAEARVGVLVVVELADGIDDGGAELVHL